MQTSVNRVPFRETKRKVPFDVRAQKIYANISIVRGKRYDIFLTAAKFRCAFPCLDKYRRTITLTRYFEKNCTRVSGIFKQRFLQIIKIVI